MHSKQVFSVADIGCTRSTFWISSRVAAHTHTHARSSAAALTCAAASAPRSQPVTFQQHVKNHQGQQEAAAALKQDTPGRAGEEELCNQRHTAAGGIKGRAHAGGPLAGKAGLLFSTTEVLEAVAESAYTMVQVKLDLPLGRFLYSSLQMLPGKRRTLACFV